MGNQAAGTQIPNQLQPYLLLSVNAKNHLWQGQHTQHLSYAF